MGQKGEKKMKKISNNPKVLEKVAVTVVNARQILSDANTIQGASRHHAPPPSHRGNVAIP